MISYDAGAASYDLLSGRWSRLYVPTLLAEAGLATGHRVLDVATGTGEAATLAGSRVGTTGSVIGMIPRQSYVRGVEDNEGDDVAPS